MQDFLDKKIFIEHLKEEVYFLTHLLNTLLHIIFIKNKYYIGILSMNLEYFFQSHYQHILYFYVCIFIFFNNIFQLALTQIFFNLKKKRCIYIYIYIYIHNRLHNNKVT